MVLPSSLLPASTQSFIEIHNAEHFTQSDLRESKLRLEEIAVGIQRV
jgi:hypothetical protein